MTKKIKKYMKWTKLVKDSFYVNCENFSGATIKSIDPYEDGLWYHYTKFSKKWKLTILDSDGNVVHTPCTNNPVSEDSIPGESVLFSYYEDNSYKYIIHNFEDNTTTGYLSFDIDSNIYEINNNWPNQGYLAATDKGFVVAFYDGDITYQIFFIALDGSIIDKIEILDSYSEYWVNKYLFINYQVGDVYHLIVFDGDVRHMTFDSRGTYANSYDSYLIGGFVYSISVPATDYGKFYLIKDGSSTPILLAESDNTRHNNFIYTFSSLITLIKYDLNTSQMLKIQIFNNEGTKILDYDVTEVEYLTSISDFIYLSESDSWTFVSNSVTERYIFYYSSESNTISYKTLSLSYDSQIYGYNIKRYDNYSNYISGSLFFVFYKDYINGSDDINYYSNIIFLPVFKSDTELRDFFVFAEDEVKGITNYVTNYTEYIQIFIDNGNIDNKYNILIFNVDYGYTYAGTDIVLGSIYNYWNLLNRLVLYTNSDTIYFLSNDGTFSYTNIDNTGSWDVGYERDTFIFEDFDNEKIWYSNSGVGNALIQLPDFFQDYNMSNGYESEDNLALGTIVLINYDLQIAQIIYDTDISSTFEINLLDGDINDRWFEIGKKYVCLNYQIAQPTSLSYTHTQLAVDGPVDPGDYIMDGTVQDGSLFLGPDSNYFTNLYPGLFVMAAYDISIMTFKIFGGLGADGGGSLNSYQYTISGTYSTDYTIFVKRIWDAGDPSVNHIIIVDNDGTGLEHTISSSTNDDNDFVLGLSGTTTKIHFLVTAKQNGEYLTNDEVSGIVTQYLDIVDGKNIANTLVSLNSGYTNILSGVTDVYNFTDAGGINQIWDGGNDMYDDGNFIIPTISEEYMNKIAFFNLNGELINSIGSYSYDSYGVTVGNRCWGATDTGSFIFDGENIIEFSTPNIDIEFINDWYWGN